MCIVDVVDKECTFSEDKKVLVIVVRLVTLVAVGVADVEDT